MQRATPQANGPSHRTFDLTPAVLPLFSFSAHCEVVSIVQSVPKSLRHIYQRSVLSWTFCAVSILYVTFGVLCYFFFGGLDRPPLSGIIFEAMTSTKEPLCTLTKLVKACMSASLLLQFPVCLFPAWTILERALGRFKSGAAGANDPTAPATGSGGSGGPTGAGPGCWQALCSGAVWRIFRLVVVGLLAVAACAAGGNFKNVCALVGSLSNGIIAFVLPPLFMLLHFRQHENEHMRLGWPEIGFNVFLVGFGAFGSLFSVVMVISNWSSSSATNATSACVSLWPQ